MTTNKGRALKGTGTLVTLDLMGIGLGKTTIEVLGAIPLTEAQERCIKQRVLNAKRNVKYLSGRLEENQFIARNALKSISLRGFR